MMSRMNNLEEEEESPMSLFLALANEEYDALTRYCNSLSGVSHAVNAPVKKQQRQRRPQPPSNQHGRFPPQNSNATTRNCIDPNVFLPGPFAASAVSRSQEELQVSALMEYQDSLRNLQKIHSKLCECCEDIMERHGSNSTSSKNNESQITFISNHLDLSKRVLNTCSSSMKRGYGPLYENGLLKNLGGGGGVDGGNSGGVEDWHKIRIVALSSYRASISKLESLIATL